MYAIFTTASGAGRLLCSDAFPGDRQRARRTLSCCGTTSRRRTARRRHCAAAPTGRCSSRSMTEATRGTPGDLASPNGKILRLNPDGTTPDDQAGFHPMYASDVHSPRGFDWAPESALLWIADAALGEFGDPDVPSVRRASTRRQGREARLLCVAPWHGAFIGRLLPWRLDSRVPGQPADRFRARDDISFACGSTRRNRRR